MARYVDGFVIPIKKSKFAAYKKMARLKAGETVGVLIHRFQVEGASKRGEQESSRVLREEVQYRWRGHAV